MNKAQMDDIVRTTSDVYRGVWAGQNKRLDRLEREIIDIRTSLEDQHDEEILALRDKIKKLEDQLWLAVRAMREPESE